MFIPVKEAYQLTFEEYWETGSQLTMYYKGKKVVDLWGKFQKLSLPTLITLCNESSPLERW